MGKKKGKRRQDDDDDWMAEMEALNQEVAGDGADPAEEEAPKPKGKGKKAASFAALAVDDDDTEDDEPQPEPKAANGSKTSVSVTGVSGDSIVDDLDLDGSEVDIAQPTVKTAAQKKAEKKERERLKKEKEKAKKAAQRERQKEKKRLEAEAKRKEQEELDRLLEEQGLKPAEAEPEPAPTTTEEEPTQPAATAAADGAADDNDDNADGDNDNADGEESKASKKKKKKKKKKDKEEAEAEAATAAKPKKKVSKLAAQLRAQQEARKLEEERILKEAEEKKRQLEEQLRKEEEEAQAAEERRQRKKQREAERKARLRAEGKLLSKSEKEKARLAKEKLEQMKALGIEVEGLQEEGATKKRPVYSKRKRNKKPSQASTEASEPSTPAADEESKPDKPEETSETEEVKVESEDDVLSDWEAVSENDDDDDEGDDDNQDEEVAVAKKVKAPADDDDDDDANESWEDAAVSDDDDDDDGEDDSEDSYASDEEVEESVVRERIAARKAKHEAEKDLEVLRSPICAVLGHVDTGKTKLLDKIRNTHVQDNEAGGITQQIGATYIPVDEVKKQTRTVKKAQAFDFNVPGLLIIDTPGHEAFSNLRSRGSSLCNIAILVVDIMHGIEPQTAESIELLRKRKAPFIIALNKVDRLNGWQVSKNAAIQNSLKKQKPHTMQDFQTRWDHVKVQFAEKSINTELWFDNKDMRSFVNVVPTSAHTGEGIPDLLFLLCSLSQKMLPKEIALSKELECTVLEVKDIQGYGTTVDVIIANGKLKEGDKVVLPGLDGPIVTQVRSLLMPAPLKDMRVKNAYIQHKEVVAAQGVKIAAKELGKAVAGLPLTVAHHDYELEVLKKDAAKQLQATLNAIRTVDEGVCVQASTLGSLEALMTFLRSEKIPVSAVNIGPVHKRDVFRASIQMERDRKYAMILAFDVPVDRDAQHMADTEGIKIFTADIIYHLEERFREHMAEVKARLREENKYISVFPCRLRILPDCIFNARDPIVIGVHIVEGIVREGTPLCIPNKGFLDIGVVSSLEFDHNVVETAKKGQDICIKIEAAGDNKKMFGRHFDENDELVSKISRKSIDATKAYFREDLGKEDWKLMIKLKKWFEII